MADAVVDASVWVSRLVPHDSHHERTCRWMNDQVAAGALAIAPVLMLPEVAGAVSRRSGRSGLAARAVVQILRLPVLRLVTLDDDLATHAASLAGNLALRGADAVYVAIAQRLGLPLVTWDREQRERAASLIKIAPAVG